MKSCVALLLLLAVGCKLDNDGKTACNSPADCVDGYACVSRVCVSTTGIDGPSGREFGTVMPLTAASSGVAADQDYRALTGTTSATGNLGCSVLRSESASPGSAAAVAVARIPRGDSSDTRCPDGNHALRNDAENCLNAFGELGDNCAVYKAWDASGQQITNRLAIGGYVAIQNTRVSDMQYTCSVELSAAFPGGVTITKSFVFSYNPFAPDSAFCTH